MFYPHISRGRCTYCLQHGCSLSLIHISVRRLNDYIDDIPYRCHHGNQLEKVPEDFSNILNAYLNECSNTGNKSPTILAKKKTCVRFLNYIKQIGCNDIGDLNAGKISQALLIYDNTDNYARIRQFMRYLYDSGLIKTDFSGIVPCLLYTSRCV